MERQGIATVAIQLLREAAVAVGPPRALLVPFQHGYPLGEPDNPPLQRNVINAALDLFDHPGPPPVLQEFRQGT